MILFLGYLMSSILTHRKFIFFQCNQMLANQNLPFSNLWLLRWKLFQLIYFNSFYDWCPMKWLLINWINIGSAKIEKFSISFTNTIYHKHMVHMFKNELQLTVVCDRHQHRRVVTNTCRLQHPSPTSMKPSGAEARLCKRSRNQTSQAACYTRI